MGLDEDELLGASSTTFLMYLRKFSGQLSIKSVRQSAIFRTKLKKRFTVDQSPRVWWPSTGKILRKVSGLRVKGLSF
jgi:hypothetical protein